MEGLMSGWIPSESIIFKESSERCGYFSIIMKKLAIYPIKPKKLQALKSFRARRTLHSFNFLRIHMYAILSENMTQVIHFRGVRI
jgi:hypothetical protein